MKENKRTYVAIIVTVISTMAVKVWNQYLQMAPGFTTKTNIIWIGTKRKRWVRATTTLLYIVIIFKFWDR